LKGWLLSKIGLERIERELKGWLLSKIGLERKRKKIELVPGQGTTRRCSGRKEKWE
jgi:hypothetical protein